MRIYRHLTANDVHLTSFPFKRELAMEAYLIENESVLALDDDTFSDIEIVDAELTLKQGRRSRDTDGRIDILATYSQEFVAVVELKLGELGKLHLDQLEDYLHQRDQINREYPDLLSADLAQSPKWIGVLVGTAIDTCLAEKLRMGYITTDGIPIAALTIQRFRSADGSIFVTTDSYFSYRTGTRDSTKYKFEGKVLGKSRLVLAIIKQYAEQHPTITFAELQQAFPSDLQGSLGVIETADRANDIYARTNRKRHFLEPEELIALTDTTVAVSNQWGVGNIGRFIDCARAHGYHIVPTL